MGWYDKIILHPLEKLIEKIIPPSWNVEGYYVIHIHGFYFWIIVSIILGVFIGYSLKSSGVLRK